MAFGSSATGGQITWNLDVDDSKFKRGMASARQEASSTADHIEKSGGAFSRLGSVASTAAKAATVALGAATAAAATFGIRSAASFEQTRIGLENMLGSADAARAMLAKVSKFAAETPFEFPELAQATRQLVAFGFSGEDAFKTMTQLGDVSAAIGAPINDLAYLMGTLRAQGRAFTIDIRQFAMRGIPIYEYLGKVLNKNTQEITEMIEAGKIGFPEVEKAFQAMTAEGGKFHNTMSKQSKSLSGLFSTLKDVVGQTLREMVGLTAEGDIKPGSLFASLQSGTQWLILNLPMLVTKLGETYNKFKEVADQVVAYLSPSIKDLWDTIENQLLPALNRLWKEVIEPLLPVIGTAFVIALDGVIKTMEDLVTIISNLITWILDNRAEVEGLTAAFATLYLTMNAGTIWTSVVTGIGTIKTAVIALKTEVVLLNTTLTGFGGWGVFAAVAIGSFVAIQRGAQETMKVLDETFAKIAKVDAGTETALKRAREQYNEGKITKERLNQIIQGAYAGRAIGGPVMAGTPYMVGERGPELFTPTSSGNITPNNELGIGRRYEYNIGTINIGSEVDGEAWLKKLTRNDEITRAGLTA